MRQVTRSTREDVPGRGRRPSPDSGTDWGHTSLMAAVVAGDRQPKAVGWSLATLSALLVTTVPVTLAGGVPPRPGGDPRAEASLLLGCVVAVGFAAAGAALVHLRPGNVVGWLLLVVGLLHAVSNSASAYGARALT